MRVAFVVGGLGPGGAERVIALLAGALLEAGHEVVVATVDATTEDFHTIDARIARVRIAAKSWHAWNPVFANVSRARQLRHALRSLRVNAAIAFITQANILATIALLGTGIHVIVAERIDPRAHRERLVWRMLRRLIYPLADALIMQTESTRAWAERVVGRTRVTVIPNPVSAVVIEGGGRSLPRPTTFIGAMGRLVEQKGFDLLIPAFASISSTFPTVELVIVGDGPERAALSNLANEHCVGHRVHFPGFMSNPFALLRHCRVFVLSSRYEGFPNVLVEAMSCGLPVVAFDCPSGPAEIIRDEIDGLLVRQLNSDALAGVIARALNDETFRARLSTAARDVVRRYATERIVRMWLNLLERTMHE